LPNTPLDEALALAEDFRALLEHAPCIQARLVSPITVSIGVGEALPADDGTPDAAYARIDGACYARQSGGAQPGCTCGNAYRPKRSGTLRPVILYVCGATSGRTAATLANAWRSLAVLREYFVQSPAQVLSCSMAIKTRCGSP